MSEDDSSRSFLQGRLFQRVGDAGAAGIPGLFVGYPFDGQDVSVGNGTMTAFQFADPERVDKLYEMAIGNGGSDEGAPGYRPQYAEGFYAAYVGDCDGNKLAFVVYPDESEQAK
ncbi:VOC family protein [Halomonas sp. C05BenzN]|uniref:VOC family protein n=1 Tax=Halomonas sp. C05BenzN TaxID=3411041 RepID=UPI003B957C82